jgi:phage shock protein PspC (stress-responsive transcriptional regulator)
MVPTPAANHDGAMNETRTDPGPHPGPPQPPPLSPHEDLDRLRRSTSNRYIAGVAGGLGRHFNIDPTIIRVLLVVLTFFGGAGLVVYGVCWLFVPEDTSDHATIRVGNEPRKILLLAAAGIAFLLAVGDAFNGFDAGWPLVSVAVIVAVALIIRDRRRDVHPSGVAGTPGTPAGTAYPTEATQVLDADTDGSTPAAWPAPGEPPTWQPPTAQPPLLAPRPKRTGVVWFWPTLALIAVGLGILGVYDNGHHVVDGAYPALALAITAVMLLVGAVVGRPGGLILIGLVSSLALAGNVAVGGKFGIDAKELDETPATAAEVAGDYHTTVGEIRLDLTQVADPQALAGREIDVHLRTGNIEIVVPRSINVDIDAAMDFAGGISVPGDDGGGVNHKVAKYLAAVPASSSAPLQLDLEAKFGQITVEYQ